MNQERLMKVLLAPITSEKTTVVISQYNQVAFKVMTDANKAEIKQAVELLFSVKVNSVSVNNVKGKKKRSGKSIGQRKAWKKAYVSLKEGYTIDFESSP